MNSCAMENAFERLRLYVRTELYLYALLVARQGDR